MSAKPRPLSRTFYPEDDINAYLISLKEDRLMNKTINAAIRAYMQMQINAGKTSKQSISDAGEAASQEQLAKLAESFNSQLVSLSNQFAKSLCEIETRCHEHINNDLSEIEIELADFREWKEDNENAIRVLADLDVDELQKLAPIAEKITQIVSEVLPS